jgi:O-antigen/teichoic acid export membrane protein
MGLNSQALIALGHNRIVTYIIFCQTVVNIIVNYTLIPIIGFEGAAIGMTLSSIIGDGLGVTILYRRSGVHPFTWSVLSPVGAVLGIGLLGYGIFSVAGLPTYLTVLILGIAYLPIVVTLAPEPEDEELLSRVEDQTGYDLSVIRRIVTSVR